MDAMGVDLQYDTNVIGVELVPRVREVSVEVAPGMHISISQNYEDPRWPFEGTAEELPNLLRHSSIADSSPLEHMKMQLEIERAAVSQLADIIQKRRTEVDNETRSFEERLRLKSLDSKKFLMSEEEKEKANELVAAKAKVEVVQTSLFGLGPVAVSARDSTTYLQESLDKEMATSEAKPSHQNDHVVCYSDKRIAFKEVRVAEVPVPQQNAATQSEEIYERKPSTRSSRAISSTSTSFPFKSTSDFSQISRSSQPPLFTWRGVEVVFSDKDKSEQIVTLSRRPLGAKFAASHRGRVKVSHVARSSYAEELGISEGWVIERVAGQDMHGKTFDEVQSVLQDRTAHFVSW